jgi:hypothetical protein
MNIQLEPPRIKPLSTTERARLRHDILTATDPAGGDPVRRTHRRWTTPAIAVTAVGAVVAGSWLVLDQPTDPFPAPATSPTAGIDKTKIVKVGKDHRRAQDLGPATPAELAAAAKSCQVPGARRTELLWSRKVAALPPTAFGDGVIVLTKSTPGQPGGYYDLGLFACYPGGAGSAVRDSVWKQQPTRARGMVTVSGIGSVANEGSGRPVMAEYRALHRVRPEFARIQSRYVWSGGQSPWTDGVVVDGFAYTATVATIPAGQYTPPRPNGYDTNSLKQEYRAFDTQGRPVPIRS